MAKVIVFANQKGGVGKSTLAVLSANHLSAKGENIGIIEVDVQKSISNKRNSDLRTLGYDEDEMNYEVRYQEPKSPEESLEIVNKLKGLNGDYIFLVDLPGKIDENYVVPFLVYADYIICPFQYESMCLASTNTFIKVVQFLKGKFGTSPELIFVPNNIDTRIGTKSELEGWKKVEDTFDIFGKVAPRIPASAELRRLDTHANNPKQEEAALKFLKFITRLIETNK